MAKIEMDVTEYDEMRKRSELAEKYAASLEDSKKEISKLHEQLQAKDKERIEELENSTKSVTYIKKEIREEIMLVKRGTHRTMEKLMDLAYATHRAKYTGEHFQGHTHYDLHRNLEQRINEGIINAFFEKTETRSFPVLEVVERKNLDAVASEIRLEEKEKLDNEVKLKLEKLSEISNEIEEWKKKYRELNKENKVLLEQLNKYEDQELNNKRLQSKVFELNQTIHDANNALFAVRIWNVTGKAVEAKEILQRQIKKQKDNGEN